MEWVKLIFFRAIRVTIGFTGGMFLVWLFRQLSQGGKLPPLSEFVTYATALFRTYSLLLIAIWIALVAFGVIRNRPRPKSTRSRPGMPE